MGQRSRGSAAHLTSGGAVQSYLMMMIGAAGIFNQAIGLQLLLRMLGETKTVRVAVFVYAFEEVSSISDWMTACFS